MTRGRSNRIAGKRAILLEAIAAGMTVAEAAARAGMSWRSVYDWRAADPAFAADYERAYDAGTDIYEQEARRRAFEGSDLLLMFLMKQRDAQRFNKRMVELKLTGDPNAPIGIVATGGAMIYPRPELEPEGSGRPMHAVPMIEAAAEIVSEPNNNTTEGKPEGWKEITIKVPRRAA
jgi:hypothetical protein